MGAKKNALSSKNGTKIAAVDLGSNTCRLIISEVFSDGTRKNLEIFSRMVRLAENLSHSESLEPAAMERAISVLKTCSRKIKDYQPSHIRCVATEACRRSSNSDFFRRSVKQKTSLKLEVISSEEEAELCLRGCEELLDPTIPYGIVFDIGGGSSEVMWVKVNPDNQGELLEFISLPFGVVGLSETYGTYTGMVFEDIGHAIQQTLKEMKAYNEIQSLIKAKQVQMIGCSGTATTIAALKLELEAYDRQMIDGAIIKRKDIEKIKYMLWDMSPAERVAHPCIGPGRSDLVVPGLSIFAGIYDAFPVQDMCVADRGVRDGVIAVLADKVLANQDKIA